jgi:filamentous hemagglutinin family protein
VEFQLYVPLVRGLELDTGYTRNDRQNSLIGDWMMRLNIHVTVLSKRAGAYLTILCATLNLTGRITVAGPEGATVVHGQATFSQSGSNTVVCASDKAIINYDSFDIARSEIVEFVQPFSSASVLNRIISANPTTIDGALLANGRVFFVNPAGVIIGDSAYINVNQLVASALDISNADFINGQYNFEGGYGSVVNHGDISAERVYLIGKHVANSGNINCPAGYVVMAAGDRVFLGEVGSDILVEMDVPSLSESAESVEPEQGVVNEGTVSAAGGTIILAAAGDIYSQAIANVGSLSASADAGSAGDVKLLAADGKVVNSGIIEACGETGGTITIDGTDVTLTADSTLHADATYGDGGEVQIHADTLSVDGVITASSEEGSPGHVLLDPVELNIDAVRATFIVNALVGSDVIVQAQKTINVTAPVDSSAQTSSTTLSLNDEDGGGDLTINLNKKITLGANQTLIGQGATVNVQSTDASIQNGIDVAAAGATITVADGIYTEDLTINKSNLTLKSANGNTAVQLIDGVGIDIDSGGAGLTLGGGASNGFEIRGGAATTFDIQLRNAPDDVEISYNSIITAGNATQGISVGAAGATDLSINNNIFTGADAGDLSIWGPGLIGLTVSNNQFIGPGGPPASGWAMQFAGVTAGGTTGGSTITGNIITGYGGGIGIFNGEGTSGLTINNNNISSCNTAMRFGQYTQPGDTPGDMTVVAITDNMLTSNTTGLQIDDGANVKASNFAIQRNSFSSNTTGLANQHTSESIAATQNYWGTQDGPAGMGPGSGDPITEVVADSVDYSPWWGDNYIGDPHAAPWAWGTNDSIQDAIALASAVVSDTIRITAGTYSEDVTADKDLALTVPSGTATLTSLTSNNGTTTALLGTFAASGTGATVFDFGGALELWGDVTLTSTNNKDISFAGTVDGAGSLTVNTSGVTRFQDHIGGATALAKLQTDAGGRTEIGAGVINLNGASAKFGDPVLLTNHLVVNEAGTGDIEFASTVDSEDGHNYTLTVNSQAGATIFGGAVGNDALGLLSDDDGLGAVTTNASGTTAINGGAVKTTGDQTYNDAVTLGADATLTGANVTFDKTISAAGRLTVAANDNITLSGAAESGGTLTLTADNDGDATGTVWAKSTLKTTAGSGGDIEISSSDATIDLDDDVDADQDLVLNNNTVVAADKKLSAGRHLVLADGKSLDGEGALTVAADDNITLGGALESAGKLTLTADYDSDGAGKMWAKSTLKTTSGSGSDIEMSASDTTMDLDDDVDADRDLLLNSNTVVGAGKKLDAGRHVVLADGKSLNGEGALSVEADDNITLGGAVESAGKLTLTADYDGDAAGTLWTKGTLKTTAGDVDLCASDSTIDLNGNVEAAQDLLLNNNTVVAAGRKLKAGRDVILADGKTLVGTDSLIIEASGGAIKAAGAGSTISVAGSLLTLIQNDDLDLANFAFASQSTTDLMAEVTDGWFKAVDDAHGGKNANAADQWNSIQVKASGNVELQGTGDIVIGTYAGADPAHPFGGVVSSTGGGVSIISDAGIYDATSVTTLDNVAITGVSNHVGGTGVDLPVGVGKAAIVIKSNDNLTLGPNCNLTANGAYQGTTADDRISVSFEIDGDPIDVAIFVASLGTSIGTNGSIEVGSGAVVIDNSWGDGTFVVGAHDTVTFASTFENSLRLGGSSSVNRLEVYSQRTPTLEYAIFYGTLPYAHTPMALAGGEYIRYGTYVLRGPETVLALAKVLRLVRPVPLEEPPVSFEPESRGEVAGADLEALLQWLAEELGEDTVQTYLENAYLHSTDLRPYKVAARLMNLATVLKDSEGTRVAALATVVGEFVEQGTLPAEEQMSSIGAELEQHRGDGSHYAAAGEWLDALALYAEILSAEMGWSRDRSVEFVMGKYGATATGAADVSVTAFIQMHLEALSGQ